jgi:RNA polymerase sigma factor (sigma-70 family)
MKALAELPPKQAAAIVFRYHHGYTNREIGAALGIPERTVASRLAAARDRLRVALGPAWNPDEPEMGTPEPVGVS